jgi:hypothetical protein
MRTEVIWNSVIVVAILLTMGAVFVHALGLRIGFLF